MFLKNDFFQKKSQKNFIFRNFKEKIVEGKLSSRKRKVHPNESLFSLYFLILFHFLLFFRTEDA